MKKNSLLALTTIFAGSLLFSGPAFGQFSIMDFKDPVEINFTGYDGSDNPTGWTATAGTFRGYGTGSGTAGGVYSFGTDADGTNTDRWLGIQFAGTPSSGTLSAEFVNNTGSLIEILNISYQAYQFRAASGGRSSFFDVNVNGGGAISGLNFTADNTIATGERGTILGVTGFPTTLSVTVSGLSISDGDTFTVNWAGFRGDDVTGSAQGIGINNISVSAIPEPSTYAAIGGILALGAVLYRRRKLKAQAEVAENASAS